VWVPTYRRVVEPRLVLTLDTSCISALANPQPTDDPDEVQALEALVARAKSGQIELQLTVAYERDFERLTSDEARADRLRWLATSPVIRVVPGVFRLDVSRLEGGDVLGGDAAVERDQELRRILIPSRADRAAPNYEDAPGAAAKLMSDVDHLIAHRMSGASHFVTLDKSTILKRAPRLAAVGIQVCLPSIALSAITADNSLKRHAEEES
jgi:hypothetical protein